MQYVPDFWITVDDDIRVHSFESGGRVGVFVGVVVLVGVTWGVPEVGVGVAPVPVGVTEGVSVSVAVTVGVTGGKGVSVGFGVLVGVDVGVGVADAAWIIMVTGIEESILLSGFWSGIFPRGSACTAMK